jgi:hypothetical protein
LFQENKRLKMSIKIELKDSFTKEEYLKISKVYLKTFTKKNEFTETNFDFKDCNNILKKFPKSSAIVKDGQKIIGQTWIVPTNRKIMLEFLENEINEQDMILKSVKKVNLNNFNSIYIFYSAILKEYRKKGLILKARKKILNHYLKINKNVIFFAWPYSKAGEKFAIKTSEIYKKTLIIKKN